ncbi:MAG: superoxide dismutase family protein [Sphingomonas sp.]|nr:superoxide dismutase family protein [Sphingomonas sp.]
MLRSSLAVLAFTIAGCVPMAPPDVPVATVPLVDASGATIGSVRVFSEATGLTLRIDAQGLPPGLHGIHVHSVGRCDAPKFTSAGGHWNPGTRQHGHLNPAGYHTGDLGNLGVGANGKMVAGLLMPGARFNAQSYGDGPVLMDADGAALVIHAGQDDEKTDPSGNSGDRIACAIL